MLASKIRFRDKSIGGKNEVTGSGAAKQVVFKERRHGQPTALFTDDGSATSCTLSPAASSQANVRDSGNFHYANHPSMLSSVNGTAAPEPQPGSRDGY